MGSKGIAAYMSKKGGGKRRRHDGDDDDDDDAERQAPKTCIYLTLHGQVQRKGFRCAAMRLPAAELAVMQLAASAQRLRRSVIMARRAVRQVLVVTGRLPARSPRSQEGRRLDC